MLVKNKQKLHCLPKKIVFLDAVFFLICSIISMPYILWVFIIEHKFFNHLPLILLVCIFLMIIQYFYVGSSSWFESRKSLRYKIILIVSSIFFLRYVAVVILFSIMLNYIICRSIKTKFNLAGLSPKYWHKKYQIGVLVLTFVFLFPTMNYFYLFGGIFYLLGHREPPVLMENPFYQTNSAGFRGPILNKRRDESNSLRMLFLGDSSTFGFPYRYEESYPYLVKEYLEKNGFSEVEIINGGMPGQSLVNMALKLDNYLEYKPDVIFLMAGLHYLKSIKHQKAAYDFKGPFMDIKHELRFNPPMLLEMFIIGMSSRKSIPEVYKDLNFKLYKKTLEEFIVNTRKKKVCLIILEYPSPLIEPEVQGLIYKTSMEYSLDFISLSKFFPDKTHYVFYDEIHPNLEGHKKIAKEIAGYLFVKKIPEYHETK